MACKKGIPFIINITISGHEVVVAETFFMFKAWKRRL